jgi:inner membrane protein
MARAEDGVATLYTHAFFGLGLGKFFTARRLPWSFWLITGVLPMVPDLDAFSTFSDDTVLGHRGFTHSLTFALALGLFTAACTYRRFQIPLAVLAVFFFLITASHGLLDACTNGGAKIPFFWPISSARFGRWGPINVADIAFELPNPWTSRAIRTELLWIWLPTTVLVGMVMICRRLTAGRPENQRDESDRCRGGF